MNTSSAQRYQEAKALADEALAVPSEQRLRWLAKRCEDDPALLSEVSWLLAAAEDESADDVPERFQAAARSALRQESLQAPMPRNYRLLERLDAGGSGVVYRAERVDGPVTQVVALKLLAPAASDVDGLARRFANERAALARLSHPNIAHLIDGGLTAEGRPFLATEYVDGLAIDRWCDRHALGLEARLHQIIKVCRAVDYAHRHMVIHRDLKPSNILVSADGEPKLLDFGVAQLLDGDAESTKADTDSAMTPAYASPEQAAGRPLTIASDVFSLGVLLHELLTGRRPFDEIEDPRARLKTLQRQAAPSLRGLAPLPGLRISADLAAIVDRALALNPDQRYPSARELAGDLERLLQRRPVAARGGGQLYRLERLVARNRLGTGLALIGLVLLASFLVDRERQIARIAWERDRAEAVTEFMNEIFSGADSLPSRGNAVTVRELLDMGSQRLAATEEFNPAVLGSIHLALGRAYNALGLGEQAQPLLVQAQAYLAAQVDALERARIQADLAAALDAAGRAEEAIAADRLAIDMLANAGIHDGDELTALHVRVLRNQANLMDVPLSETVGQLETIERALSQRSEPPPELLFETRAALVATYVFLERADQALTMANAAQALAISIYSEDDPRRLRGRHVLATALMLSDPDTAAAEFEQLIADHQRLIGPSQRLANSLGNQGVALSRAGRDQEAIDAFAAAAAMIEQVAGREHYLYRLSIANRAALHLRADQPQLAEALIRKLLNEAASLGTAPSPVEARYRASALDILGSALALQGRLPEAAAVYREALAWLPTEDQPAEVALRAGLLQRLRVVEGEMVLDEQNPD
ncbi:MAG: protein kinase domain-containing protein [Wenzhouxiangella sp.]